MKPRRIFALFLSLLMILSLVPGTAFAEGDTSYEDGSYTGSATVEPDEDEDFDAYDITVKVTVENGAIASVAFASEIEDEDNETYANKAMDGTKSKTGVAEQIVAANGTDGVDTVSGATCTSKAIITAVEAALKSAVSEDPGDTDTGDTDTGDEDTGDTDTGDTDTGDTDTGDEVTGDGDAGDTGTESESNLTVTIPEDLQDGTYTGGATVCYDEDEAFSDYPITVAVSVSNGVVSGFSVSGASGNNAQYSTKAKNGLNSQLADKTAGSYEVDAVSTATCSSKAIVEAINTALQSDPSSTSIALGSAIYDVEGTTFTVTITNPAEGVDYSDITLAYAVGKFSSDLDESAYSVALTSESENEPVYTVTLVADSGTDIEDDELTHSVSYNSVGMALNVTVAGTTVGQITIESSAVYAIENNTLTITGGNGETLADYIDAVSELIFRESLI
ncbi:MAG: FMN-binding protein [Clostridiales bacterium]|nr:FMN-binding protein [Clostridiales bacterium]